MQTLIKDIANQYPSLKFSEGKQFCWSPETEEVFYIATARGKKARWSLLHETGHALLQHKTYQGDFELLRLEVQAWERARALAKQFGVAISEDHIQDCLDTYRDWLNKRSICPSCTTKTLQQGDFVHYRCYNCHTTWRVSTSRFCRSYRRSKDVPQTAIFNLQEGL